MSFARPFAYNPSPNAVIAGTEQVGDLAVGTPTSGFTNSPTFWNGPDETQGYVIASPVSGNTQQTPVFSGNSILSPTYKGNDITLVNSQSALQQFGYQQSVLGQTLINNVDKVMFSVQSNVCTNLGNPFFQSIGVGTTSMNYQGTPTPYGAYPGNDTQSVGFSMDGNFYFNGSIVQSGLPTWTSGNTIDVAVNLNSDLIWIRVNGGAWAGNPAGANDPATNQGGLSLNGLTFFYPVLSPGNDVGQMTIQNSAIYGIPSGYTLLGSNVTASVGFFRSSALTDPSFISIANAVAGPSGPFASASNASIWLTTNGYWNSWVQNGSILFPTGTNSYVRANTAITLGVGNFTVEGWVYMTSNPATNAFFLVGGSGNRGITILNGTYGTPSATQITIEYETAGFQTFTVPTMVANVWYYIAVSRNSSDSMSLWLNGVRCGNYTVGFTFIANNYSIGAWPTQGQYSSDAYISNVRMTTTNVYDVNSLTIPVPITNFTNVPGTQLLMNTKFGATWLVDSSSNNITMVANGSPSSSNYEPFTPIP